MSGPMRRSQPASRLTSMTRYDPTDLLVNRQYIDAIFGLILAKNSKGSKIRLMRYRTARQTTKKEQTAERRRLRMQANGAQNVLGPLGAATPKIKRSAKTNTGLKSQRFINMTQKLPNISEIYVSRSKNPQKLILV